MHHEPQSGPRWLGRVRTQPRHLRDTPVLLVKRVRRLLPIGLRRHPHFAPEFHTHRRLCRRLHESPPALCLSLLSRRPCDAPSALSALALPLGSSVAGITRARLTTHTL